MCIRDRATGGSCRCARSRSAGPWCSTHHGVPGRSSRHWWPTTWTSAAPTASSSSSPDTRAVADAYRRSRRSTRPRSSPATPWSPPAPSTSTPGSSSSRALRIETVINSPTDLRCLRRLQNLDELQAKGRDVNARMLNTERVGQSGVLASPAFERVALPTLTADGRRAPALRFGDPRVMALLGALCFALNAVGFTHRSLRAQVSQLLGAAYNTNQMSYDHGRLRINELIERREHTNIYDLTPDGQRVAVFYTKVHDRLLRPLLAADRPPAPPELRHALSTIDRHVHTYTDHARLGPDRQFHRGQALGTVSAERAGR